MKEHEINCSSIGDISFLGIENSHVESSVRDEPLPPLASRSEDSSSGDNGSKSLILGKMYSKSNAKASDHYKGNESQSPGVGYKDVEMKDVIVSEGVRVPHGLVQMQEFDIGAMVWGKVKSHPWWPGHIFSEAFASSDVRRSKREGHFLVAFFGDNSYGWFHPSELIPFDPHFTDKSKQTTMRNFVNAVEEAVDETSRREALGLTCFCRNKFNFRPAKVPGYFHVDVPSFEPGGVYSSNQISDARDGFQPRNALSFVKQAALNPLMGESLDLDRIKSMATVLAYRRAVFEEFDDTYAQAFGVEPIHRSSAQISTIDQPDQMFASQATPLSGQMVVSEFHNSKLVAGRAATVSSADQNKFVLKRREERGTSSKHSLDLHSSTVPCPSYCNVAPSRQLHLQRNEQYFPSRRSCAATGEASPSAKISSQANPYLLHKRHSLFPGSEDQRLVGESSKAAVPKTAPQQFVFGAAGSTVGRPHAPDKCKQLKREPWKPNSAPGGLNYLSILTGAAGAVADSRDGVRLKAVQPTLSNGRVEPPKAARGTVKKINIGKHLPEDVGFVVGPGETGEANKKKKKKKAPAGIESGVAANKKRGAASADPHGKFAGKSITVGSEQHRSAGVAVKPDEAKVDDATSGNVDLRLVVSDIQELAANQSYGSERRAAAVALRVVRRYRSLVYEKGRVVHPTPTGPGAPVSRSQPGANVANKARLAALSKASAADQTVSSVQSKKVIRKSDDPTKGGRKRTFPEGREETSGKRLKTLDKLEKKAAIGVKVAAITADGLKRIQKGKELSSSTASPMKEKPAIAIAGEGADKKLQEEPLTPPPRTPSPTVLIMKFPPTSTLPSVTSLKARFARFGPLDQSAIRVFWTSYTCKVVYKFKPDAETAFNYVKSHDVFGEIKVTYYLRELDGQGTDPPPPSKLGKQQSESSPAMDVLQVTSPGDRAGDAIVNVGPSSPLLIRPPNGQLKSILKKPREVGGQRSSSSPVQETSQGVRFKSGGVDDTKTSGKTDGGANGDAAPSHPPSLRPPPITKHPRLVAHIPRPPIKSTFSPPAPVKPVPFLSNQHIVPPLPLGPPPPLGPRPSFTYFPRSRPPALPQLPVPAVQLIPPTPPCTLVQPPAPARTLVQPPFPVAQLMPSPPPCTFVQPPAPVTQLMPSPPPPHTLDQLHVPAVQLTPSLPPRAVDLPHARSRDPRRRLQVPAVQLTPLPPPRAVDVPPARSRDPRSVQQNEASESSRNELPDISEELMALLLRCKDVVNNVKDALGYLPYHPI